MMRDHRAQKTAYQERHIVVVSHAIVNHACRCRPADPPAPEQRKYHEHTAVGSVHSTERCAEGLEALAARRTETGRALQNIDRSSEVTR